MKQIFILWNLLLLTMTLSAQYSIKGKVGDGKNPLEGVTVSLLNSKDSSLVKFSISSKSGDYEIEKVKAGKYFLSLSAIGFAEHNTTEIKLDSTQQVMQLPQVSLTADAQSLGAVTVVGRRPMVEVKADRTLVNVDAAASNVGATALEVLEKSPGVSVDRDGIISLKGKQGVLVMIDGKPTYLSGTDLATMLGNMNANQLDQIEIMTNPPAKYDAAGNSGVINIKTKKNKQKGFNGNVTLGYGQGVYWKTNNSLNLNYRNKKFNVFMNLSANSSKGFGDLHIVRNYVGPDGKTTTSIFEQPTYMKHQFTNNNLKLGMDYNISKKTSIGIVGSGFISPRRFDAVSTGFLQDKDGVTDSTAHTISTTKDKWKNGTFNLNLRHEMKQGEDFSADLDYVQYNSTNSQLFDNHIFYPDGSTVYRDNLRGDLPSDIRIYSAKVDHSKTFSKGFKLESGLKSSLVRTDNLADYYLKNGGDWEHDYSKTNHFLYEENINAAYVNASNKFGKWNVQAGLRFENTNYKGNQLGNPLKDDSSFRRNYNSLFPTVYVSFEADSNNTFTVNTGRRIDRPAYQQLNPFLFFINKFTYASGNPFLQPQYTTSFEVSHSYKGKLNTSISYNRTKQFFTQIFRPVGEVTILTEGNLGESQNLGFSINAQLTPASWWNLSSSLNVNYKVVEGYAYGQDIETESFNGQVNINNQFNFKKGWGAELSGFYNSRDVDGQFDIKPFGQVSIGLSKQVLKGKGSVRMNVRDLFRTQVIDGHIKYGNVDEHFIQSRDSRVFNITFNYRFGKQFSDAPKKKSGGGASEEQNRVRT